jgi:tRNA(Ile)-lysidine synthase
MEKSWDIIKKVQETLNKYSMTAPGDRVVVALSGGPDSVCLLDALHRASSELNIELIVAHFDHGLRGEEDDSETHMTRDMALSMGLVFETQKALDLAETRASLEEHARESRYAFLETIRHKHNAKKIAMGHNLNDQAETLIMRLLRGSGPSGLSGIPPVRNNIIIRPLIEIKRDEIMNYLKERRLTFAFDISNSNKLHLRNRIRHELLPMMLDYQPRLLEHLSIASNIMRDEDIFLDSMATQWIDNKVIRHGPGDMSVSALSLKDLPYPLKNRVIRILLKQVNNSHYPLDYDHIISVSELLKNNQPQCSIDLPDDITVRKTYNDLHFLLKAHRHVTGYTSLLEGPGTYNLDAAGQTLTLYEVDYQKDVSLETTSSAAFLDADKLKFPLTARNFKPGDRFIPLGMKGHKKVKNFFIDLKVPTEKRVLTPILTCQERIVWICGYRIDERFKVSQDTKRIMKATIFQKDE